MKISAHDLLKAKIVEVRKGATTVLVKIDVRGWSPPRSPTRPSTISSSPWARTHAVIKASDVMIGEG